MSFMSAVDKIASFPVKGVTYRDKAREKNTLVYCSRRAFSIL